MSADATAWTFRHSPHTGTTFAVHLAIADSVSDTNGNEFWMMQANLAVKARCGRQAVNTAVRRLVDDGLIEPLTSTAQARATNSARRYRFLFPDVPAIYESRTLVVTSDKGVVTDDKPCRLSLHESQREPNSTQERASADADGKEDDTTEPGIWNPRHRERVDELPPRTINSYANAVTTSWYEDLHNETGHPPTQPFVAVAKIVTKQLKAKWTPAQVRRALDDCTLPISAGKLDGVLRDLKRRADEQRSRKSTDPTYL